ncbi:MAG: hypothetical protein ABI780_14840 [Ardenticatenales bacterium]
MPHPLPARPHPRQAAARLARPVLAGVLTLAVAASLAGAPAANAQTGTTSYFPDAGTNAIRYGLLSDHPRPSGGVHPAAIRGLLGQEGYGKTTIEIANGTDADASASLRIYSKFDGASAGLQGATVGAGRAAAMDMTVLMNQAGASSFAAELTTTGTVAALARTRWSSGAGAAFEAAPAARTLLLPLIAVNLGTESSVLVLQNASPGSGNMADVSIADPITGAPLVSFPEPLEDHQVSEWDTSVEANLFGPGSLAPNAAGGFLGALRVSSSRALALLGYVDEHGASATAGIVGRPIEAAATVQILPRVRSGASGGTLIALANATDKALQATIRFRDASGGPSGALSERKLTIAGGGAAYLDLAGGGRSVGTTDMVASFDGSAMITASAPVLAAALEDERVGGKVDTLAGYNGYGPRDLSTRWMVPVLRRATDYVSSEIVLHNPSAAAATARVQIFDSTNQGRIDRSIPLGPGASASLNVSGEGDLPYGTGRATIDADQPIAVLVYERRDTSREYPPKPLDFSTEDERNSMVKSDVRLTPEGTDLRVNITITAGDNAGGSFTAQIQATTCSMEDAPALYPLTDVAAGKSVTTLNNVDLRTLTDGHHALRLIRGGGRFGGRVSCGIIPEVRGVEVADTTAVRALALAPGPDELPTAGPTAPTAPPAETTAPPRPTATGGPATPTFIAEEPVGLIYLPVTRRDER